ncbi:MAG: FtsX-like permease family protein, partial [bacterium]
MSFLRFALSDVIRNRRRTFSSILGVLLAVTFIAGTFIAIDSSTRATLDALLLGVPGDFLALGQSDDPVPLASDLLSVAGVTRTTPFAHLDEAEIGVWNATVTAFASGFGIDPMDPPEILGEVTLRRGTMELPRGSVALSEFVADSLGVVPGDTVYLLFPFFEPEGEDHIRVNLTVEGVFATEFDPRFFSGPFGGPFFGGETYLVHLSDAAWLRGQLGRPFPPFTGVEIWIDRDRFVDPYNLQGSREGLVRLQRQLQIVAQAHGAQISANLLSALSTFESSIAFQRIFFLMLSAPVILLGLYLGAVGVDLGHAERRRELAILKARGAGPREVTGLLLLQALIGGLVATLLGLLGGALLSRLLLGLTNPLVSGVAPRYEEIVLRPETVVVVFLFSVLFMGLVSYRSAKRTAKLPIVETLRHYAPGETKIEYRPTMDVMFVAVALVTFGVVLYSQVSPGGFFLSIFGIIFFVLTPVAPILLIIGTTRLATRSTGRLYEVASRAVRPLAPNLHHVISRNLARNPRRASNISVIIALGLGFGLFVLVLLGSQIAFQDRNLRALIGADVQVIGPTEDATFGANVSALPGVETVARVVELPANPIFCCAQTFALEPAAFFAATQPEPWQLDPMSREHALDILAAEGLVLLSKEYAEGAFLRVGDLLRLESFETDPNSVQPPSGQLRPPGVFQVNVTVGGIVRGLPSLAYGGFSLPRAIYGSFETFGELLDAQGLPRGDFSVSPTFFVDLEPGAPARDVGAAIRGLGGVFVRVYEEERERQAVNPFQQGLLAFIGMEVAFVAVILTAGLGL